MTTHPSVLYYAQIALLSSWSNGIRRALWTHLSQRYSLDLCTRIQVGVLELKLRLAMPRPLMTHGHTYATIHRRYSSIFQITQIWTDPPMMILIIISTAKDYSGVGVVRDSVGLNRAGDITKLMVTGSCGEHSTCLSLHSPHHSIPGGKN